MRGGADRVGCAVDIRWCGRNTEGDVGSAPRRPFPLHVLHVYARGTCASGAEAANAVKRRRFQPERPGSLRDSGRFVLKTASWRNAWSWRVEDGVG